MSSKFKDTYIKNHTYYFLDDVIDIKVFDLNSIKIGEKSCKHIPICYIGCVTIKDSNYIKINSVNPLYLIIHKVNGYFEEINKNKYLTLVPTNERKKITKNSTKKQKTWKTITKISDDWKIYENNSDDKLPLNKAIETRSMIIVVKVVVHENNKYYPQVFLNECLDKLWII